MTFKQILQYQVLVLQPLLLLMGFPLFSFGLLNSAVRNVCIGTAVNNQSASSKHDTDLYLKRMFPNVPSIQIFSCGKIKSSYMTLFGIAPHVKSILDDQLLDQLFGSLFDKALNKSSDLPSVMECP